MTNKKDCCIVCEKTLDINDLDEYQGKVYCFSCLINKLINKLRNEIHNVYEKKWDNHINDY